MVSQRELDGLGPPPSLVDSARLHPRERAQQRRQRIVEADVVQDPNAGPAVGQPVVAEAAVPQAMVPEDIVPQVVGSQANPTASLAPDSSSDNRPSIRISKREFDSLGIASDAEDLPRAKRRARPVSSIAGPPRCVTRSAGVIQGSSTPTEPVSTPDLLEGPLVPAPPLMRHCESCLDDLPAEEFPQLNGCQRGPNLHTPCFARWLAIRVADTTEHRNITCPCGCGTILTREDVERYAEGNTLQAYDDILARELAEELGFRNCIRPGCNSGQIHDSDNGNIFICHKCRHRHCTTHDVPFHDGETCEDYDNRLHREAIPPTADEIAGQEYVDKHTKNCPGPKCGKRGEKMSGCDHMTCKFCKTEYCWCCLALFTGPEGIHLQGNSFHAPSCPHHPDNLPNHPHGLDGSAPVHHVHRHQGRNQVLNRPDPYRASRLWK